jgi:GTP-binding protein
VTARDEPGSDPVADLRAIDEELERYSPELARRPAIVALNKVDLTHVRRLAPELSASLAGAGRGPVIPVSATTGEGVGDLLEAIHARLSKARAAISPPPSRPRP